MRLKKSLKWNKNLNFRTSTGIFKQLHRLNEQTALKMRSPILTPIFCLLALLLTEPLWAQPSDLPWDPDPDCNSIVTTGIVAATCGTTPTVPEEERWTFGLINITDALPAAGRIDVTLNQDMYHHPSWHIDSIGNVFGITIDHCGNIYTTASSNYSSFFFTVESIIQYGNIGGGVDDLDAAGTIYKIDGQTGQATPFAVLPQQAYTFEHFTCEGFLPTPLIRTTGPGLGNITFSSETFHFYVTNFEDGRIYRLDTLGTILDSYDPLQYDNGDPGVNDLPELAYGITLSNDNSELFFGTCGDNFLTNTLSALYSIPINPDGSFVGSVDNTNMPAGATWDNYVGTEQFHTDVIPTSFLGSSSFLSDLEFTPGGDLLVGNRIGCNNSIQTSYNHGGRALLFEDNGSGIFDVQVGVIYTSNGALDENNAYGGVAVYENPNGINEFVFSSADMLSEAGPHGIVVIEEGVFGGPFFPASPAGVISYTTPSLNDPKGIGGDVFVFKECACQKFCPEEIETEPLVVCSNEPFSLTFSLVNGNADISATWTDEDGNPIADPDNVSITHTDCAPGVYEFYLTSVCQEDLNVEFSDTLQVTVVTDDLSPFITSIEEDCFIDVLIEAGCEDFISIVGDIPVIGPGDSGTVTIDLVQTTDPVCTEFSVDLSFDCSCVLSNFSVVEEDCEENQFLVTVDLEGVNTGDTFSVIDQDGNPLGTFSYSDLPIQLGPFTGDSESEYTLTIEDEDLIGCGGSVSFGPTYCPLFLAEWQPLNPLCVDDLGTLSVVDVQGGLPPYVYSIDGGQTFTDTPIFENLAPGTYDLVVQDAVGTEIQDVEVLFQPVEVIIEATSTAEIILGDFYQIDASTNLGINNIGSITWTPATGLSCTNCLNPVATPSVTTEYTVVITDLNGCEAEARVLVTVQIERGIYIPNAFSPNDDGENDLFLIFAREGYVTNVRSFLVFDRWGDLVHEYYDFIPGDPAHGWDGRFRGKLMNSAVFAYFAIVETIDGEEILFEGDVTLVR
jgi:gliding motility-associated-like protein